jgi:hypothetical protein
LSNLQNDSTAEKQRFESTNHVNEHFLKSVFICG